MGPPWVKSGHKGLEPSGGLPLPFGSHLRYNLNMAKKVKVIPKKRGRPATGRDPLVALRLPPSLVSQIEKWVGKQDSGLSRSEAIRRLVEKGLASAQPSARHSKERAAHAHEKAAQTIDSIVDKSASTREREKRKGRLLKGPEEFQTVRRDLPKPKG